MKFATQNYLIWPLLQLLQSSFIYWNGFNCGSMQYVYKSLMFVENCTAYFLPQMYDNTYFYTVVNDICLQKRNSGWLLR